MSNYRSSINPSLFINLALETNKALDFQRISLPRVISDPDVIFGDQIFEFLEQITSISAHATISDAAIIFVSLCIFWLMKVDIIAAWCFNLLREGVLLHGISYIHGT